MEVAKWMLSTGAATIVLVGRSLPTASVQVVIQDWNRAGSSVVIMQADIGEYNNCTRLLEQIKLIGLPRLRGIIHAAGVLSDAPLNKQSFESMTLALKPKVFGSWYLHQLTLDYQLNFFVLFSSLSGIFGLAGQSNHAASNEFLDALAHYRVSVGLPATTINWGTFR